MTSNEFTRDFQIRLLINMLLNQRLFSQTVGQFHLEDFGLPACRLLFEVARKYFLRYKKLPGFSTLELEVVRAMHDQTGEVETRLAPMELEILATIMAWLAGTRAADLDPDYFASRIPDFLAFVRLSKLPSPAGVNASQYLQEISSLHKQLSSVGGGNFEFVDANAPLDENLGSARERFGTGVMSIDKKLGGGLTRQQMGLLVACSGVGKTTGMINFAANAALAGFHCLFITIELPRSKIIERYQTILAGIDASNFKKARSAWAPDVLERWNIVTSPDCPLEGTLTVVEKIGDCTVFTIDQCITAWKAHIESRGKDPAKCLLVCVDWLDRIDPKGLARLNRDSNDERTFFRVVEYLDTLKVKHDLILWTATQGATKAIGKEVLNQSDTGFGVSKNHLVDLSMAFAPKQADTAEQQDDDDASISNSMAEPPCDRELVTSFLKTRDNSAAGSHVDIYQGPSLRLWSKKSDAEAAERKIRLHGADAMFTILGEKKGSRAA